MAIREKVFDSLPKESALIRWVEVDLGSFYHFSTMQHVSKTTFARLSIPDIFPETILKVLYLDADTLVLEDLKPLWETDLEGAILGAVLDGIAGADRKNGTLPLNVPKVEKYFNAGVLLINLANWRRERISEKSLEYLALNPNSPFSDQDALNFACDRHWKELDLRWNFLDFCGKRKISDLLPEQRPAIVHFASAVKPWHASARNANASLYNAFRNRTRFARTPKDKVLDRLKVMRSVIGGKRSSNPSFNAGS
jgi:lipopolysaccharide biosynthesis glycosyltransferase